ncbi:Galactomannan galactosyltransferase 1 [Vitis vinifera]|nr:Galactomannan galactosyltransferase 1 [Vitis vinifera]
MVSPEHSQFHTSPMAKSLVRGKAASVFSEGVLFVGGALVAFLLVWGIWSMASPASTPSPNFERVVSDPLSTSVSDEIDSSDCAVDGQGVNLRHDPPDPTFYDNPKTSYKIGTPVKNWDEKRREWLKLHPSFAAGAGERILMLTGSQPTPCKNPIGDHFLLRFFKNKVDYCRIHGYDIFYNNVLLQPKMFTFWAKLPVVRAAMMAHPEAEWIWWVDSDAAFTDMDFKLP